MKQIIQSFKTGKTILEEIPAPTIRKGTVLIETTYSLVSLGTEKMLVEFGKSNLISKARQQPEKVKLVLDKIKTIMNPLTIPTRRELSLSVKLIFDIAKPWYPPTPPKQPVRKLAIPVTLSSLLISIVSLDIISKLDAFSRRLMTDKVIRIR